MIITIKHMLDEHIENIGSGSYIRLIIKKVWEIFIKIKNPNKEILKAMFNKNLDLNILKKVKIFKIV
jgi:hypothetical protein